MTPNRVSAIAFRWSISAVFTLCVFAPKAHAQSAANAISGVYNGTYTCAMGPRTLKLSLLASGNGSLTGVFTFYLPPTSHTKAFSYSMSGTFDAVSGKFKLNPVKWETPPPGGYVMVGMDGAFDPGAGQVAGKITYGSCGAFQATRDQAESANIASVIGQRPSRPALGQNQPGVPFLCWTTYSPDPSRITHYISGVFQAPATFQPSITDAWTHYLGKTYHVPLGDYHAGFTCLDLSNIDPNGQSTIQDTERKWKPDRGEIVRVDWKYQSGLAQAAPAAPASQPPATAVAAPSRHVRTFLIYCSSWTGPDVYVSDKFEVPFYGRGGKSNIMAGFRQFLHEKYSLPIGEGLTLVGCGVDMGVGGGESSITSVEANVEANAKQGKKIVKTGWKYVGTLPPPESHSH